MRHLIIAALAGPLSFACGPAPEPGADAGATVADPDDDDGAEGDGSGAASTCPLAAAPPTREVTFTRGVPDGDPAIEDRLLALIDGARTGARLRVAFAYLDQEHVAEALGDAADRGVDVGVVLDERNQMLIGDKWAWNDAVAELARRLGDRLVLCGGGDLPTDELGGCVGDSKQHAGFVLVSGTCDGASHVVAQTSAHPTRGQLAQHNNLVVVREDRALFDAYGAYWDDLAARRRDPDYYAIVDGDSGTRLFLYPRAGGAAGDHARDTDTIYRLLHDNVDCSGGTRVRVAMAYWSTSRGYLVDELARLAGAGCVVDAIVDPDRVGAEVAADLRAVLGKRLHEVGGVHHKALLIDGGYSGARRRLVWTGTQDFTLAALRDNDETILRIEDDAVHAAFDAGFDAMLARPAP